MKAVFFPASLCTLMLVCGCHSPSTDTDVPGGRLVTGKRISDAPQHQPVGSLPMNMIGSADGRYVLVSDMGYRQSLWSIRSSNGQGVSHVQFPNQRGETKASASGEAASEPTAPAGPKSNGLYYGLAEARDGTVYAAQGGHDSIAVLKLDSEGGLHRTGTIQTRRLDFPAGLALDDRGLLFVSNNRSGGDNPFRSAGSVSIYDPAGAGHELGRCELPRRFLGTSGFPLALCAFKDGSKAYVASERDDAVYVIGSADPVHPTVRATIATGSEPVGMTLSADQRRLFVANARSDSLTVIDTVADRAVATLLLRPPEARGLRGATPVAVTLSPDQHVLHVALADMNAIAVVDVADTEAPALLGYLPTGWYPSAVIAAPDGKRLLVADAKGSSALNPNAHLSSTEPGDRRSYILNLLEGDVRILELPDRNGLKAATKRVLAANDLPAPKRESDARVARLGRRSGRIQHVFYVIKENRTYDQVLGDLPEGNGDKSLTIFGRDITPNLHALAERFVLLDNTYCSGEVSGDGWCWSTQGMASAYVVRNVPYNYSGRGRKFDFEGQNNGYATGGYPTTGPTATPASNPLLSQGGESIPDVGSAGNHLWDAARRAGVTLRNYGFYLYFADSAAGVIGGPDNYPAVSGLQPGGHDLDGISDLDFRRFDLDYADSDAPQKYFERNNNPHELFTTRTFGAGGATSRFAEWRREFELVLQKDPTGASIPALNLIRFGNDHTTGMKAGKHSPRSMVADNDYAVGQLVETISHSPIWKSSAIFIIEDDAQGGEDHVDSHRTTCFVVSPWIRKRSIDHRFYNTDSVLKSIELLLGIAPMTQYEAIAAAIDDWSDSPENSSPFDAILPTETLIGEVNPQASELEARDPKRALVELSARMDFRRADAAPSSILNDVVWKSVRGPGAKPPACGNLQSMRLPDSEDDEDDKKGRPKN